MTIARLFTGAARQVGSSAERSTSGNRCGSTSVARAVLDRSAHRGWSRHLVGSPHPPLCHQHRRSPDGREPEDAPPRRPGRLPCPPGRQPSRRPAASAEAADGDSGGRGQVLPGQGRPDRHWRDRRLGSSAQANAQEDRRTHRRGGQGPPGGLAIPRLQESPRKAEPGLPDSPDDRVPRALAHRAPARQESAQHRLQQDHGADRHPAVGRAEGGQAGLDLGLPRGGW